MKTLVGVIRKKTIITTKLMRKPYHITHCACTNHLKLFIRTAAAKVEATTVVTHMPMGVVNHKPKFNSWLLFMLSPKPVKRGANPRIAVSHPPRACHWRKKVTIIVATIAKPSQGFRVRL